MKVFLSIDTSRLSSHDFYDHFPVLVTLFTAFTNYDFNHIPPASLIDWVGAKTLVSSF